MWVLFLGCQGLRFPVTVVGYSCVSLQYSSTLDKFFGGRANYCNFGLCCQQPQRSPQAMMGTLLAVALHHPDGRAVTPALPLPSVCSVCPLHTVPAVYPHKAEQFHQLPSRCAGPWYFCWYLSLFPTLRLPPLELVFSFLFFHI